MTEIVHTTDMEIQELKRKHRQYIGLLKTKINELTIERNKFEEQYTHIKSSARALTPQAAIIRHLEELIVRQQEIIDKYQRYYTRTYGSRLGEQIFNEANDVKTTLL